MLRKNSTIVFTAVRLLYVGWLVSFRVIVYHISLRHATSIRHGLVSKQTRN